MTEKKFYKKVRLNNPKSSYGTFQEVYLFKIFDDFHSKEVIWMTAFRDRNGDDFIAESGAGIPEKKMEQQLMSYLRKKIRKQGYI